MSSSRVTDSHPTEPATPAGRLTTHVLDISVGKPAAVVRIELHSLDGVGSGPLAAVVTGADGRCSAPLLEGARLRVGRYALTFHVGEYFRHRGVVLSEPAFLEEAVVHFGIAVSDAHYHVPLLIAPWSYTVYRGG